MDNQSFWDSLADNAPTENMGYSGEELPPNAWALVETATSKNGKAAPEIRMKDRKDDSGSVVGQTITFNVGLLTLGGDKKLSADKHNKKMIYIDLFPHPGDKEREHSPSATVGGRFTGFLNALFATGVALDEKDPKARAAQRWRTTIGVLTKVAESSGLTIEQYKGDTALYLAALAVKALETPRTVLIKTTEQADKKDKSIKRIKVGSFDDNTAANLKAREIVTFTPPVAF